ncbi:hypothetical protein SERLA73DRAFT_155103 [Serpula lacrymans var. lacrymans S7.3]|uniref:Uncharacterized protein n=1 Tax=Serpula lacrymans var. lacrymans (strain S7.3) TaxID=936435 RepID=F8Q8D9_SERL3|nr:hypothetical protein SERLA73DRAFT_155103 [Serpula lacrymans var. lacrymans S7.3]
MSVVRYRKYYLVYMLLLMHFTSLCATLVNATKSTFCAEVAKDVGDAIFKTRACNGELAEYREKDDQEVHLQAMFEKWSIRAHIKKGCLVRPRQDIHSDGSRIEGSHKGWNSLMRSHASGIEVFSALGHNFVTHHNIHVELKSQNLDPFISSTYGTHHNEIFGLVSSENTTTFGGLLDIKHEELKDMEDPNAKTLLQLASENHMAAIPATPIDLDHAGSSKLTLKRKSHISTVYLESAPQLSAPPSTALYSFFKSHQPVITSNRGQTKVVQNQTQEKAPAVPTNKWSTFCMTSRKWVEATCQYNTRLEEVSKKDGLVVVKKNPRTLFEKLDRKGSEFFWKWHCKAICLVKDDQH